MKNIENYDKKDESLKPQLTNKPRLTQIMAARFNLDREQFVKTVKATCFKEEATDEQFVHFLSVANEYNLNPFTKEIYAYAVRGGIEIIVSIDGWLKIINSRNEFDGMEFIDQFAVEGDLISVTCHIHRSDRAHPTMITEYMAECKRKTDAWEKYPIRMLRHKATIQAARYAFGLSGIVDADEAERIREAINIDADVVVEDRVTLPKARRQMKKKDITETKSELLISENTPINAKTIDLIKSQLKKKEILESELCDIMKIKSIEAICQSQINAVFEWIKDPGNNTSLKNIYNTLFGSAT